MIAGIGHDIVTNNRIKLLYIKYGQKFVKKILSELEQDKLQQLKHDQQKILFIAKRFAAKEAFAKACGTGIRSPILLQNISIINDQLGKPTFIFAPELDEWLFNKKITHTFISISDEIDISSAFVILEIN